MGGGGGGEHGGKEWVFTAGACMHASCQLAQAALTVSNLLAPMYLYTQNMTECKSSCSCKCYRLARGQKLLHNLNRNKSTMMKVIATENYTEPATVVLMAWHIAHHESMRLGLAKHMWEEQKIKGGASQ